MNTTVEEKFTRQAKRQKRCCCVSPDRAEDCSSIGYVEDYLTDDDREDDYAMHQTEERLCESILCSLEYVEEESLIYQSRMRTDIKQKRKNPGFRQTLVNERLQCRIFKVLTLIVQSPTLLGRLAKERTKSLLCIASFIEKDWGMAIEDSIYEEFRTVLRFSFMFPPQCIYLPAESSVPLPTSCEPKHLCFDFELRRNKLIELSHSVLTSLSKSTRGLLQQRLESLGNENIFTKAPLETTEGLHDILQLWTDMVQRTSATALLDEQALGLYHDALCEARSISIDSMLWNFVYYLSR